MGFGSMVAFMVKWSFAAIPAIIIISVIVFAIIMLFMAVGAGMEVLVMTTGAPPRSSARILFALIAAVNFANGQLARKHNPLCLLPAFFMEPHTK
jgi:hypothetical protein